MRARFDGVEGLGEFVEVFLMPGYEIYVAPQAGEGRALVALLLDKPGGGRQDFSAKVAACAPLRERMRRAVQRTPVLGAGPLGGSAALWQGDGWLLAGDAASSLDPITGEGVAVALRNGALAARHAAAALRNGAEKSPRSSYFRERQALLRSKRLLEGFMLNVSRRPRFAGAVLSTLRLCPAAFSALLHDC